MPLYPVTDSSGLLLFILEVSLKGSLILAAAGLATTLLRKSPAAIRHTIWTTALALVVILPAIVAYAPGMEVGLLPADKMIGPASVPEPDKGLVNPGDVTDARDADVHATHVHRSSQPGMNSQVDRREAITDAGRLPSPSIYRVEGQSAASSSEFDWKIGLLLLWLVGTGIVLLRYGLGWMAVLRLKRGSEPVADVRFRLAAIKVARSIGLKRRVNFVWGDSNGMPLTWGWIRPTVLLPQDAHEWEAGKIISVLRHELAHIKRNDCLVQGLVYLVCAIHWFNPLVWIAAANSRREREIACDDYVISSGTDGTAYADHLLDIARSLRAPVMSGVSTIAMARPSELEGRLMAILSYDQQRGTNTRTGFFTTMGLLAVFAIPLAALRPVPMDSSPSPAAQAALDDWDEAQSGSSLAEARNKAPAMSRLDPAPNGVAEVRIEVKPSAPVISLETQEYLAQVNEIVEKAARTLESLERLEPSVSAWKAEFGDTREPITLRALRKVIANPDTIPVSQIRRLKASGIDVEYIDDLASVGLDHLTIDQLASLAHAEIDGGFVRAMQSAGYDDLDPDQLVQLGFAGVDPEDVAVWVAMGYDDLSVGDLTRLVYADVDANFVSEMQRSGYTRLTADELIRLSHAEIDTDFIREMGQVGLKGLSSDDLIRMGHADVDAEFVQAMRSLGFSDLSADDLVRMAHAEVDVEFVKELRELGLKVDDVDEIVRLKYMNIDAEYLQRIRETKDAR